MSKNIKINIGDMVIDTRESMGLTGGGGSIGLVIDRFKTGERFIPLQPNWMCTILWENGNISNRDQHYLRNIRREHGSKEKVSI